MQIRLWQRGAKLVPPQTHDEIRSDCLERLERKLAEVRVEVPAGFLVRHDNAFEGIAVAHMVSDDRPLEMASKIRHRELLGGELRFQLGVCFNVMLAFEIRHSILQFAVFHADAELSAALYDETFINELNQHAGQRCGRGFAVQWPEVIEVCLCHWFAVDCRNDGRRLLLCSASARL